MAKYRQHGYQDRDEKPRGEKIFSDRPATAPKKHDNAFGPRPVNLPGTREVSRCTQCGTVLAGMPPGETCPKCGFELHSCKQCAYFDPGKRFECMKPVAKRVEKKDVRNDCQLYELRVAREKETSTPVSLRTLRPNDARQAFENLFKK